MSAVSKRVMPASRAAPTTASVSLRPMRMPKLLQPSPTTLTLNEPIVRVSIGTLPPGGRSPAGGPGRQYCTGDFRSGIRRVRGGRNGSRRSGRDGRSHTGRGVGEGGRLRRRRLTSSPASTRSASRATTAIIGMFGMEIRERLLARDEESRVISYSVVDGVPIDSHTGHHHGRARRRRLQGDLGLRRDPRRDGADLRRHLQGGPGLAGERLLVAVPPAGWVGAAAPRLP